MLISVAEYESMQETLDLLSDDEALVDLRQSREDFTYRIIYRIDEAKRAVEIHSIRHRGVQGHSSCWPIPLSALTSDQVDHAPVYSHDGRVSCCMASASWRPATRC